MMKNKDEHFLMWVIGYHVRLFHIGLASFIAERALAHTTMSSKAYQKGDERNLFVKNNLDGRITAAIYFIKVFVNL